MKKKIDIIIDTEIEKEKVFKDFRRFLIDGLKSEEQIIELKVEDIEDE